VSLLAALRNQRRANDAHQGSGGQGSRTNLLLISQFAEKRPNYRRIAADIPFEPANSLLAVNEPRT